MFSYKEGWNKAVMKKVKFSLMVMSLVFSLSLNSVKVVYGDEMDVLESQEIVEEEVEDEEQPIEIEEIITEEDIIDAEEMEEVLEQNNYMNYLNRHENVAQPDLEIIIEAEDFTDANENPEVFTNYEGMEGISVLSKEEGFIEWEFDVEEEGLYSIELEYYPYEGKGMSIARELSINGEVPFDEASYIAFTRVWENATDVQRDVNDNDRRPSQTEAPKWLKRYVEDDMRYYDDPFLFYFEEGTNTLRLKSEQDYMLIRRLTLKPLAPLPSYEEKVQEYEEEGYEVVQLEEPLKIQAENAELKSDAMLYPTFDRSSPATEPSHPSKIRLNTIGGGSWSKVGQWLTWEVEVPESGLYQLGTKFWQNFKSGRYVTRTLKINDEIPFEEMRNLQFNHNTSWGNQTFGGQEDPYLFYLDEGKNTITMEVSLGDLAETIQTVEESVFTLNFAYRQMLMVIGGSPDMFRDYRLDVRMPSVIDLLGEQRDLLEEVSTYLSETSGQRGATTSMLDTLIVQLDRMYNDPDSIPGSWDAFRNNISALGAWVLEMQEQPLQLDYLYIYSDNLEEPKSTASFVDNISYQVNSFFASFTEDYSSVGSQEEDAIRVWVNNRDYGNIINSLVENDFNLNSDVKVNIEIVDSATLLPATLAGEGPDVALQVGIRDPVNYAIRNAVVDLSQFDDFTEVAQRFTSSALTPYQFEKGVYALPETQTFPMLFYRTDIFEELGIEAPNTWDDVYQIMPYIQKSNMNIGIPINGVSGTGNVQGVDSTLSSYTMFLYQNDGSLYTEYGEQSLLAEEEAVEAFREWTSLYVNYSIPVQYDFANRFRTGEMPIGIADYSTYNYLSVFAPELRGLWEMIPIPGTELSNGSINRSASSSGVASTILATSDKQEEAWEFLKWWTSADVQTSFGKELESVIGVAARYATANQKAAERMGWTSSVYQNLLEQWDWVVGNPEVPGGYFTPRHVENAFRKVYNELDDPRETILDYTDMINLEIEHKRQEFGLDN